MTLRFHPDLTLTAAARLAQAHGMALHVYWDGCRCIVVPLKIETGEPEHIPMFLRKQAS